MSLDGPRTRPKALKTRPKDGFEDTLEKGEKWGAHSKGNWEGMTSARSYPMPYCLQKETVVNFIKQELRIRNVGRVEGTGYLGKRILPVETQ